MCIHPCVCLHAYTVDICCCVSVCAYVCVFEIMAKCQDQGCIHGQVVEYISTIFLNVLFRLLVKDTCQG